MSLRIGLAWLGAVLASIASCDPADLAAIHTPRGTVKLGDRFDVAHKVLLPEGVAIDWPKRTLVAEAWRHPTLDRTRLDVEGKSGKIELIDWDGAVPAAGRAKLRAALAKFGPAKWSVDTDGCAIYAWQSGDIVRVHTIFDATGETSEGILIGKESTIRSQGFPYDKPEKLLEDMRKMGYARPKPLPASAGSDPITGTWAGDIVNPQPDGQNGMVYAYRIVFASNKTFHLDGNYAASLPGKGEGTWSFDGTRLRLAMGSEVVFLNYDTKHSWLQFPRETSNAQGILAVLRRIKL